MLDLPPPVTTAEATRRTGAAATAAPALEPGTSLRPSFRQPVGHFALGSANSLDYEGNVGIKK
jgi:hypothetical protein